MLARLGSLNANAERFMFWRSTDGANIESKGIGQAAGVGAGRVHPG